MKSIHLEIVYEGDHCIPCVYMAKVVESVAKDFGDLLHVEKVVLKRKEGAKRFYELSCSLGRPAPIPSIFIEGELVFDQTPGQEELKACLERFISNAE